MVELPDDAIIGAVVHRNEVILPDSETTIQENDRIIVLSMTKSVRKVEELFSSSGEIY